MSILIEDKDLSLVTLSLELEQATIAHTLQGEKKIYVTAEDVAFPFWLQLYEGPRLIFFSTYTEFGSEVPPAERHAFCNRVNGKLLLPAVHEHDGRLYADHAMSYRDGLLRSQFIRMCRFYAEGVESIVRTFDPDHAVLKPLDSPNNA